jgi:hypothetical protein
MWAEWLIFRLPLIWQKIIRKIDELSRINYI